MSYSQTINFRTNRRYHYPGNAHFITFSCYQRAPLLHTDEMKMLLAKSLSRACKIYSVGLWGYVFMPEHVHLLVMPRENDFSTGRFIKQIKSPTTIARMILYPQLESPLWLPGGGHDRNIHSFFELREKLNYIHLNPVRRGLSVDQVSYRWSSASIQTVDIEALGDLSEKLLEVCHQ